MARVRTGLIKYISQITFRTEREQANTSIIQKQFPPPSVQFNNSYLEKDKKQIWGFHIAKTI